MRTNDVVERPWRRLLAVYREDLEKSKGGERVAKDRVAQGRFLDIAKVMFNKQF